MKMFWKRSPENQYKAHSVGKMKRELSYFSPAATKWYNVSQGQPSSFWPEWLMSLKNSVASLQVGTFFFFFFVTDVLSGVCAAVEIPTEA